MREKQREQWLNSFNKYLYLMSLKVNEEWLFMVEFSIWYKFSPDIRCASNIFVYSSLTSRIEIIISPKIISQ